VTTPSLLECSKEQQLQIGRILFKLNQLSFGCAFQRLEEGPILRTFFFIPALDALFSKVINKEEEIAGALSVESARLYRVAGFLAVEVPRADRQLIRFDSCLHNMLTSPQTKDMSLPLLMGQNPKGDYLYTDLATQPHLLIAGATGSGKSIATSQLICSMALMRPSHELEFILVDTKNLDLVLFKGLEHVSEVITDIERLREKLQELIGEHDRRAAEMTGISRNIREWNTLGSNFLKYKVLIIDELADVFERDAAIRSTMDKEEKAAFPAISALLKRIAQVSRATGIHIICATQRPSVGMITGDARVKFGDIKANFPARFCFKFPTMADSRVVLDENGAELLLGKGDYLYKIAGADNVQRAHSAFVSINDITLILSQHKEIRGMYAV
jgi:DNA segregation ATPase FtsK/SpoIIIE, S-DNA-T family